VVGTIEANTPAATALKKGDVLLAVDGKPLSGNYTEQLNQVQKAVGAHKDTPVAITVRRAGTEQVVNGKTFYDAKTKRYRFGFSYDQEASVQPAGPLRSISRIWPSPLPASTGMTPPGTISSRLTGRCCIVPRTRWIRQAARASSPTPSTQTSMVWRPIRTRAAPCCATTTAAARWPRGCVRSCRSG